MGSPVQVRDSASNIVKWGLIALVIIVVLMFMFPWLLNLGVANMNAAWSDQITAFLNSLSTTAADAIDPFVDMVTPSDEPSPFVDFYSDVQTTIDDSINSAFTWINSWWPF